MAFISVNKVCRTYGNEDDPVKALADVSFNIEQGEFTVILGPSGSGKSTLLNLLGGMDRVTEGRILVDDKAITELSENEITDYRRADVGFVFQFYNLIPSLNAYENINIAARIGKESFKTKTMLAAVGLEKRGKHFPSELSGGELQRTAIARALVKNPKLLLCDEPTGALDTATGQMILDLLYDMSRKYGKTVLIVTHNDTITAKADKVIKLKDGKVLDIQTKTKTHPNTMIQETDNRSSESQTLLDIQTNTQHTTNTQYTTNTLLKTIIQEIDRHSSETKSVSDTQTETNTQLNTNLMLKTIIQEIDKHSSKDQSSKDQSIEDQSIKDYFASKGIYW